VEENPFKKLIDISDLMELEKNPEEVLKEIQNNLLRHNSDLKQWYKVYSRKIEVTKSEESFAMTLKQVWRFLRDTHLVSANSTLAQFDRVYNNGKKNNFVLLGSKDEVLFNKIYKAAHETNLEVQNNKPPKDDISEDEDEDEEVVVDESSIQREDIHDPLKIIL
jgi:hypothetical protein